MKQHCPFPDSWLHGPLRDCFLLQRRCYALPNSNRADPSHIPRLGSAVLASVAQALDAEALPLPAACWVVAVAGRRSMAAVGLAVVAGELSAPAPEQDGRVDSGADE